MTWRLLDLAEVARHERQSGHDAEELPQVIVAAVRRAGGGLHGWVANQCIPHDFGEQDVYFAGAQAMPFPNGGPQQHPSIFSLTRRSIRTAGDLTIAPPPPGA